MIGGPRSPPSPLVASKKRAMDDVLHGNAIIMTANLPAFASNKSDENAASLSRSWFHPPPFSPSLSICTTFGQPEARMAAVSPSARA